MRALIGLDVGTSGARAIAVDAETGELLAETSSEFELLTPKPGWTEQHPEEWWEGSKRALAEVAGKVDGEIAGLGLTGQMHGSVFLDEKDDVIRPALLWNDQRTSRQCDQITETVGAEELVKAAGNPALTGFQAPKILWLRDEEPGDYARVRTVLLPKDYVRLRLTGEKATDASDASGTLLLDVADRTYSDLLLEKLEIPREWLPAVMEGTEQAGAVRDEIAEELGLPRGLPVAAGGGDNAAAAVGVAVAEEGQISSSVGTSGVVFAPTDSFRPDPSGRIHAFCHALPGRFHAMAVTLSAGGSLRWWRDTVGERDFDALVKEAAEVEPGSEGLVFLPYLTGERTPHLDPQARGAFVGLTVRHGRGHMTRAVMEGVVLSLRDGLEIMRGLGLRDDDVHAVGGGARSPLWRQLQADVYGRPVKRTLVDEGPAYGAALLAGVAGGEYADAAEAMERVRMHDQVTEPDDARARAYEELYAVYGSMYPALRDGMHALASH